MRRIIILPALLLAATAWADVRFATPHSTTSYYTPCFPLYATSNDGAGTLTGMSGSDANFIIYAQIDNTAVDIEYQTTADIETIATIGTYAAPTADTDIRFGECGTPGTYQLQPRDTLLATTGAKGITFKLTDGVDTMADQIVYLDLNVADETDLRSWIQAEIEEFDPATGAETDFAHDAIEATQATMDGKLDAVKLKTDDLTFTVSGQVDSNAESMNATEICGDGSSGDKWGGC